MFKITKDIKYIQISSGFFPETFKLLFLAISCNSLTVMSSIFVLFLQENGLSMTQIMILQSVYTGIVMLTIVPAGIFADFIGRKTAIVLT